MGTKERRQREKEQRRRDILDAAKKVFFSYGFKHTSMEKIAESSQLAKGTLYLYFKTKEELYISLIEDGLKILSALMQKYIGAATGVENKLLAMTRAYYRFSQEHEDFFNIFTSINAGDLRDVRSKVDPDKLARLKRLEKIEFTHAVSLVRQGIDEGLFRDDLDPGYAMIMIWWSISGAMMHCKSEENMDFLPKLNPEQLACDIVRGLVASFKQADIDNEHI